MSKEAENGEGYAWKADLVIIVSRRLTGFRKLLIGSVSPGTVSHAHCSVFLVR